MDRSISLDMGFDNSLVENPDNQNRVSLTVGFVNLADQNENPFFLARNLQVSDQISMRILDVSTTPKPVTQLSFQIIFRRAQSQDPMTPVRPLNEDGWRVANFYNFQILDSPPVTSPLFGRPTPCWIPQVNCQWPSFPEDQILAKQPSPLNNPFMVSHSGFFYYTAMLLVVFEDGQRTVYRADPEMITADEPLTGPGA